MPHHTVVLLIALLVGTQSITTDLFLPVMPGLADSLGATMGQMQLTLTALLLAFGASQLVWGPLSDRFGRRPILLWGLSIYVIASVVIIVAPTVQWLIAGRAAQGWAMGAAVVCARALVRDLYEPAQGAHTMSKGLSGLGVIACLSAPLGGLLSDLYDWRAAMLSLAVYGVGTLVLVARQFRETLSHRDVHALQWRRLLGRWALIARHPTFWAYTALSCASFGGLFTFLASSSFVVIKVLGFSKTQYGLLMLSMSASYIVGTLVCRRLLPRFGVRQSVKLAALSSLSGGLLMLGLAYAGWHSVWAIMLPFYLFMIGHGVLQACGQSGAIGPFPQAAGTASALSGFLMMVVAFGMGHWLGLAMDGSVYPLVHGVAFWGVAAAIVAWTLVARYGGGR